MEQEDTERTYVAPELTEVGDFADLTLGGAAGIIEGYTYYQA